VVVGSATVVVVLVLDGEVAVDVSSPQPAVVAAAMRIGCRGSPHVKNW
jgi:hypothetical protein